MITRKKSLIYILAISFLLMVIEGEKEIVIPALPSIKADFASSYSLTQGIVYLNFLGFCLSCLFSSYLIQLWGYRRIFCLFSSLFLAASLLTCATFNLQLLILGRFFQGVTSSVLFAAAYASIGASFSRVDSARYLGMISGVVCLVLGGAPLLGAYIISEYSWQMVFYLVAALSFLSLLIQLLVDSSFLALPKNRETLGQTFHSLLKLHKVPAFLAPMGISALMLTVYMIFVACAPYLIIDYMGLTRMHYGLSQGISLIFFSLTTFNTDKFFSYFGEEKTRSFSIWGGVFFCWLIVLVLLSGYLDFWFFTISTAFYFATQGLTYNIYISESIQAIPGEETHSSTLGLFYRHGLSALGMYLASVLTNDFLFSSLILIGLLAGAYLAIHVWSTHEAKSQPVRATTK